MHVPTTPPWQLSLREFGARGAPCPPNIETEMEAARIPLAAVRHDVETLQRSLIDTAGHFVRRRVPDLATRRTILGALVEWDVRDIQSALRSPNVPKSLKAEYKAKSRELAALSAAFIDRYDPMTLHRRIVGDALAAGLPVPTNVLADYPELSGTHAA